MAIPRTAMIDDDGSGTTGTIINNAWKTELYDQIDKIGQWVSIPHGSLVFTAAGGGGGTWVVDPADLQAMIYTVVGRTIMLSYGILSSTVTGTPTMLRFALPGVIATRLFLATCRIQSGGVEYVGRAYAYTGINTISVEKTDGSVWSTQANTTLIQGELYFEATSATGLEAILKGIYGPDFVPDITQPAPPLGDLIARAGGDPALALRPPVIRV